jgi:hypothetical protein
MAAPSAIEFDLHGLVGIRLEDPGASDALAVQRQLGLARTQLQRSPDIVLRFCDRIDSDGPVRLLGLGEAGFTDDRFLLLRGKDLARVKVALRMEDVGLPGQEVLCERGLPAVPLLMDIVNLTALGKGVLPLHASAFEYEGAGVLVTGWAKGGKTEVLLGFMAAGATHIGDEWVYLPGDGRMLGIPEPMRLWDWHLEASRFRKELGPAERARLAALRAADRFLTSAGGRTGSVRGVARRMARVIRRQRFVHATPQELFGDGAVRFEGRADAVFLTMTHDAPQTEVFPAEPLDIAARMVASLQLERNRLWEAYRQHLYAFPDRRSPALEEAEARESQLLPAALGGLPAFEVRHPYPVDISALVPAMRPLIEK